MIQRQLRAWWKAWIQEMKEMLTAAMPWRKKQQHRQTASPQQTTPQQQQQSTQQTQRPAAQQPVSPQPSQQQQRASRLTSPQKNGQAQQAGGQQPGGSAAQQQSAQQQGTQSQQSAGNSLDHSSMLERAQQELQDAYNHRQQLTNELLESPTVRRGLGVFQRGFGNKIQQVNTTVQQMIERQKLASQPVGEQTDNPNGTWNNVWDTADDEQLFQAAAPYDEPEDPWYISRPYGRGDASILRPKMRPATAKERAQVRQLAGKLQRAELPQRHKTAVGKPLPPGRLHIRGTMQQAAYQQQGRRDVVDVWKRTQQRLTPAPKVDIGIACDCSGSMHKRIVAATYAMWLLAASIERNGGSARTVLYNTEVRPFEHHEHQVPVGFADGGTTATAEAIGDLVQQLKMLQQQRPAIIVLISDGDWGDTDRVLAQMKRLRQKHIQVMLIDIDPGCAAMVTRNRQLMPYPLDAYCKVPHAQHIHQYVARELVRMIRSSSQPGS